MYYLARKTHEPNKDRIKLKKPLACSAATPSSAPGQPLPLAPAWPEAGVQQLGWGGEGPHSL